MTRTNNTCVAVLVCALAALAFTAPALAQQEPEGCPGSVKTTDAGGKEGGTTNQNPYSAASDVYLQGSGFPAYVTSLTYTILDVNSKDPATGGPQVKKTGTIPDNVQQQNESFGNGAFLQVIWTATERIGINPEHEYKVVVSYSNQRGMACEKSDNFFAKGAPVAPQFAQQVASVGAASVAGGQGAASSGWRAFVPTVACPRGISVRPGELAVGERTSVVVSVRRGGRAVRNALVVLRGPGIRASKVTGASGFARFTVTATRPGILRVFVPNVCVRRAGVAGVTAGGAALAG